MNAYEPRRNQFGMSTQDYDQCEMAILKIGQVHWLSELRHKIYWNIPPAHTHEHCNQIGLPIILYERTGKLVDYVTALRAWVNMLERKAFLARIGGPSRLSDG